MPRIDDGAADRVRYTDQALEKCRQACRRAAVVPAALIAIRPLAAGDPLAGWEIHLLSLEGGLVDPADLFRGLREELDRIIAELERGASAPHEDN